MPKIFNPNGFQQRGDETDRVAVVFLRRFGQLFPGDQVRVNAAGLQGRGTPCRRPSPPLALRQTLASGKVILVLGARQVGKTTLVEQVLRGENVRFLNFDVEIDKTRFLAAAALAPDEALRMLGAPKVLVLDEAQRLPATARIVKGWHDAKVPTRLLLLGSSSLDLLDQSAESLTGRNRKLVLPPLLFAEALQSQDWCEAVLTQPAVRAPFAAPLRALLLQRLAFGSYPEVVLSADPRRLLRELSADYLWKDILQTGLVKTPDLIRRLLLLLAHQAGSEVSVNELATQLQMGRPTVERYLDLLEQTFVIFRLPAYLSIIPRLGDGPPHPQPTLTPQSQSAAHPQAPEACRQALARTCPQGTKPAITLSYFPFSKTPCILRSHDQETLLVAAH